MLTCTGSLASTLGTDNPLRYRGYIYDTETGLYYLQARYYNPVWGRFISSDTVLGQTGGINTQNGFAYCLNDPVNNYDPDGKIVCTIVGALVGGLIGGISAAARGGDFWTGAAGGAVAGAIAGMASDIIILSGGTAAVGIGAVLAVGALGGAVGGYCGNLTYQYVDNKKEGMTNKEAVDNLDYKEAAISGGISAIAGFAGAGLGYAYSSMTSADMYFNSAYMLDLYELGLWPGNEVIVGYTISPVIEIATNSIIPPIVVETSYAVKRMEK